MEEDDDDDDDNNNNNNCQSGIAFSLYNPIIFYTKLGLRHLLVPHTLLLHKLNSYGLPDA
jgi:hypothetical protein